MMRAHITVLAVTMSVALASMSSARGAQHEPQHPAGASSHMEHRFEDAEAYSKVFDNPARDAWQLPDRVIATLDPKPGTAVADIGAGTRYFAVRLAKTAAAPTARHDFLPRQHFLVYEVAR